MDKSQKEIVEAKVILLGNSGVGKTSLINVATNKEFNDNELVSTFSSYILKDVKIKSINYSLNLWDTAGQEQYRSISNIFFKGSDIAIFVYDITNKQSFNDLNYWINQLENTTNTENKCVYGILGNKMDLYKDENFKEKVNEKDAREFAKSKGIKFATVSAKKDPTNFEEFLIDLVKDASDNILAKSGKLYLKYPKKKKRKC